MAFFFSEFVPAGFMIVYVLAYGDFLGGSLWAGALDGPVSSQVEYAPATEAHAALYSMLSTGSCCFRQGSLAGDVWSKSLHGRVQFLDVDHLLCCKGRPLSGWGTETPRVRIRLTAPPSGGVESCHASVDLVMFGPFEEEGLIEDLLQVLYLAFLFEWTD